MDRVRLGVIGCGVMGFSHLRAAAKSPLIELAAVADPVAERAGKAAEFGAAQTYPDGATLLADDRVEAVVLAMPTALRTPLALQAFNRGKHVLLEKPVAMNAGEVDRMIAARGALVGACCSSRYRFLPSAQATADFIATGALGEVRVIHARQFHPVAPNPEQPRPAWRLSKALNGGGFLVNWGCYDLDYLLGLTDWSLRPERVSAQTWPIAPHLLSHVAPGSDAETHFIMLVRCAGGAMISFERAEYIPIEPEACWQIIGSKGALQLYMRAKADKKITFHTSDDEAGLVSRTVWEGDEALDAVDELPVHDFAEAIRTGRPPKTTLEQSLVLQKITDAVYASAARGCEVALE